MVIAEVNKHVFQSFISSRKMGETMIQMEAIRIALQEGTGGRVRWLWINIVDKWALSLAFAYVVLQVLENFNETFLFLQVLSITNTLPLHQINLITTLHRYSEFS